MTVEKKSPLSPFFKGGIEPKALQLGIALLEMEKEAPAKQIFRIRTDLRPTLKGIERDFSMNCFENTPDLDRSEIREDWAQRMTDGTKN